MGFRGLGLCKFAAEKASTVDSEPWAPVRKPEHTWHEQLLISAEVPMNSVRFQFIQSLPIGP